MKNLNYSEMGILSRRHGITVTRQVEGVAYVTHRDGSRGEYAIEHLRSIAGRPWAERLRLWIAGVAV